MADNYKKIPSGGYGIIQTSIMKLQGISIQAKAIYCLLVSYTGSNQYCWPSIQQMAIDMDISKGQVSKLLTELENKKLIKRSKLKKNPWVKNNKYEIFFIETDDYENSEVSGGKLRKTSPGNSERLLQETPMNNNNVNNNNVSCLLKQENYKILYKIVLEYFKERSPPYFQNKNDFGREGKHIKAICEKAIELNHSLESQKEWLDLVIGSFKMICEGKSGKDFKFCKNQIFIPSRMNAKGMWPIIIQNIEKYKKKCELEKDMEVPF